MLKKYLPSPHSEIIEKLIIKIFSSNLRENLALEGGTSLMLKYWHRPSYDIDLKYLPTVKTKTIRSFLSNLIDEVALDYRDKIIHKNMFELEILNRSNQITKLKIDFRPFNCFYIEEIRFRDVIIPKLVDEIIFLNKLIRFNERDKKDIEFLLNKLDKNLLLEILNNCKTFYCEYKKEILEKMKKLRILE
jgi:hypothetical protein